MLLKSVYWSPVKRACLFSIFIKWILIVMGLFLSKNYMITLLKRPQEN